jgi:hypothetical protein
MNQISAFEFIHPDLEQFQKTKIYYLKKKSIHQIFMLDSMFSFHTIYIFKYDVSRDTIVIYHTTSEYSGVHTTEIKKNAILDNVFELFEWLTPKLTTTLTKPS